MRQCILCEFSPAWRLLEERACEFVALVVEECIHLRGGGLILRDLLRRGTVARLRCDLDAIAEHGPELAGHPFANAARAELRCDRLDSFLFEAAADVLYPAVVLPRLRVDLLLRGRIALLVGEIDRPDLLAGVRVREMYGCGQRFAAGPGSAGGFRVRCLGHACPSSVPMPSAAATPCHPVSLSPSSCRR